MTFHAGDVRDTARVARIVDALAPDAVVHLAAMSAPAQAEAESAAAYAVNLGGTLALLGAVRATAGGRVLDRHLEAQSTAAVAAARAARDEDTPFRP